MVADELDGFGIIARVVGEVVGGEIVGHVEGHVVQLRGAVGDLGETVILHQVTDGGVVVAEQKLNLVGLLDEADLLGGEVAVILVPHGSGVVLALLVEDRQLLALGQGGLIGIPQGGVGGEEFHLGGNGGGEEGAPNEENDGTEDQKQAHGFDGDLRDPDEQGLVGLFAHGFSSLSAADAAAAARSFMKRSLSRAFCKMISAERVSMTPFRLAPLVSVSLR